MKSQQVGKSTLPIEVANISAHGFWIAIESEEYFLAFSNFPWFAKANIEDILNIELLNNDHIFWPGLDIDLTLEIIKNPEKFPLIAKSIN